MVMPGGFFGFGPCWPGAFGNPAFGGFSGGFFTGFSPSPSAAGGDTNPFSFNGLFTPATPSTLSTDTRLNALAFTLPWWANSNFFNIPTYSPPSARRNNTLNTTTTPNSSAATGAALSSQLQQHIQALPTTQKLGRPFKGKIETTCNFGSHDDLHTTGHKGIDLVPANGNPTTKALGEGIVVAVEDGKIAGGRKVSGHGNSVAVVYKITRNGQTKYLLAKNYHLKPGLPVKPGDKVTADTTIGQMGSTGHSTGPHCHLELYVFDSIDDIRLRGGPLANPHSYIGLPKVGEADRWA